MAAAGVRNRPNAAGVVNDEYFDVRIFDDDDNELPAGTDGEIVVRPKRPHVMFEGYWGRPEATVETSRNWWYHTGDIGRIDDDGFLYFVDRKADYLRRRGENISSFEVESVLMAHGALADVAVHAVPSQLTEDDLKVTATVKEGAAVTEEELFRWCIDQLPVLRPAALHRVPRRAAPQPGGPGPQARAAGRRRHRHDVGRRGGGHHVREALMATRPGFHLFLPQLGMTVDELVERARAAEAAGFDGIALMDHLAPPGADDRPMYEAMTLATLLAARTERLTVGHLVLCDAFRQPAVLARQAVTIDHVSGGRFELGIGSGSVPAELETFGIDAPRARVARLGETLDVLQQLWTGEVVDYDGTFHRLRGARQLPVPSRRVPIVIGATGPRMLELVAAHADWWNLPSNAAHRLEELRPAAGRARCRCSRSSLSSPRTRIVTRWRRRPSTASAGWQGTASPSAQAPSWSATSAPCTLAASSASTPGSPTSVAPTPSPPSAPT